MPLIGLTGGYACGKSLVLRGFVERGAHGIDCDRIAREITAKGEPGLEKIAGEFGQGFLLADGGLNRAHLASLIFNDEAARKRLEGLLHPIIFSRVYSRAEGIMRKDSQAVVVVDAPLLYEAGMEERMDKVVVVTCPLVARMERGMARDRISREQAAARIAAQTPLEEKAARADYVIDNSGAPERTAQMISDVWEKIAALRK